MTNKVMVVKAEEIGSILGRYTAEANDSQRLILGDLALLPTFDLDAYIEIAKIRKAIANYMRSEGCSCCEDLDAHEKDEKIIAELLNVPKYDPKYDNGSGYDFDIFCTKKGGSDGK